MGMGKKNIIFVAIFLLGLGAFGLLNGATSYAQEDVFNSSGLEIPRFVSLKKNKVFVRTGPALRYPIKWVYKRGGQPVEIVQEFDTWRKVKDVDGEEGWIHQSLISGRRTGVVASKDSVAMFKKPNEASKTLALIEPENIVRLESCADTWCAVEIKGFSGYLKRNFIWGVYENEKFD